jgi:hypothetical protein
MRLPPDQRKAGGASTGAPRPASGGRCRLEAKVGEGDYRHLTTWGRNGSLPSLKIRRPLTSSCAQACSRRSRRLGHVRGIGLLRLGRLRGLLALEDHPFGLVVPAGAGVIVLADAATEHLARQRGFQLAADQPLELANSGL